MSDLQSVSSFTTKKIPPGNLSLAELQSSENT